MQENVADSDGELTTLLWLGGLLPSSQEPHPAHRQTIDMPTTLRQTVHWALHALLAVSSLKARPIDSRIATKTESRMEIPLAMLVGNSGCHFCVGVTFGGLFDNFCSIKLLINAV